MRHYCERCNNTFCECEPRSPAMSNAQPAKMPKIEVDSLICDGIIGLFPTMDEGEDLCIATMVHPDWLTTEQVKERAQFIAEACNSYPELQAKLADTEFMRSAMQADLEAAGKLLGCDFDQVVVTLEELEKPCVWTQKEGYEGDREWDTSCGESWTMISEADCAPVDIYKFCPECGHPIKEQSEETNE